MVACCFCVCWCWSVRWRHVGPVCAVAPRRWPAVLFLLWDLVLRLVVFLIKLGESLSLKKKIEAQK